MSYFGEFDSAGRAGEDLPSGWEEARKVTSILVDAITPKDHYTADHALQVARLAWLVGMELGLSKVELERLVRPSAEAGNAHRRQPVREFLGQALDALAHVRRSSIDAERWRYSVEKLRAESPATVAAYVCALRERGHEDEARARDILEERATDENVDLAALEKLMDAYAALASRARASRVEDLSE